MKRLLLLNLALTIVNIAYTQTKSDVKNLNASFETGFIDDTSTIVYFQFQLDNPSDVDSIFVEMGSESKPLQLRAYGEDTRDLDGELSGGKKNNIGELI